MSTPANKRNQPPTLQGRWFNELGSEMNLEVAPDGRVTGTFRTAVADRPLPPARPLVGLADAEARPGFPQAVAFVVDWGHHGGEIGSVTAWSGQLRSVATSGGSDEVLTASWLLTSETPGRSDWASTMVGHDTFTRVRPDPEAIARARAVRERPVGAR